MFYFQRKSYDFRRNYFDFEVTGKRMNLDVNICSTKPEFFRPELQNSKQR